MTNPQEPEWIDSLDSSQSSKRGPIRSLRGIFAASELNSVTGKAIELVIFALTVPIIGRLLFPHDPVGLNSGFAWLALLPIIFAARYGVSWGLTCAAVACLSLWLPVAAYAEQGSALLTLAVGTVVMCILVGDISVHWRRGSHQAKAENKYLRHRLKEFSNDYHILKVSHGQLEEYMAGQRLSLRSALQKLKPVLDSGVAN